MARPRREGAGLAFARLQGLVGEWRGTTPSGSEITCSHRMNAGGTVLVETWALGPGAQGAVLLPPRRRRPAHHHYCPLGNQPRLILESVVGDSLIFEYRSATNLPDPLPPTSPTSSCVSPARTPPGAARPTTRTASQLSPEALRMLGASGEWIEYSDGVASEGPNVHRWPPGIDGPCIDDMPIKNFALPVGAGVVLSLAPAAYLVLFAALLSPGLEGKWLLCLRQLLFLSALGGLIFALLSRAPRRSAAAAAMMASAGLSIVGGYLYLVLQPADEKWGSLQRLEENLAQSIGEPLRLPDQRIRIQRVGPTEMHLAPRDSILPRILGDDPLSFDHVVVKWDEDGIVREVYVDYF